MQSIQIGNRKVAQLGQGTWNMGDSPMKRAAEVAALRRGLELGLSVIDTAEMYGNGRSEQLVGEAIAYMRDQTYLVSKVLPSNASTQGTVSACEASLRRLRVETLDLYLLHWPGRFPLEETAEAFDRLLDQGKIQAWGVSNFDVSGMREVRTLQSMTSCTADQGLCCKVSMAAGRWAEDERSWPCQISSVVILRARSSFGRCVGTVAMGSAIAILSR